MNLDKLPRSVLIAVTTVALLVSVGACKWIVGTAFADLGTVKKVAYEARNEAVMTSKAIVELKEAQNEMKVSSETFRREYREDQKDLDRKLNELLRRPS